MPVDEFTLHLSGMSEVRAALAGVTAKIRKQAIRKALREAAKVIQSEARAKAPVLQTSAPFRRPGTIRRNIVVRASKFARRAGNEGVYVSVKPLRGAAQKKLGQAGAKNPNDPYYWWWQEFGWVASGSRVRGGKRRRAGEQAARVAGGSAKKIPGKHFMTNAASQKGHATVEKFMSVAVPIIAKINAKANAKESA